MYPRILKVEVVCKCSSIFSNLSIQPGHECFVITGTVNPCYGLYSLSLILVMLVEYEPMYNCAV